MKLLIFSDNHRDRSSVNKMLEDNKDSDYIFSLGDSEMPEHELSALNIVGVKGNYPFEPKFSYNLFLNFLGVDVFFTHGHRYNVKLGISRLLEEAKSLNAEIVCFGHTHQAYLRDVSGIIFLNPGSCVSKLIPAR